MNLALTQENRRTLGLSSIYGITFFFYLANFYSFGVSFSAFPIVVTALLLGPLLGFISLALDSYLLQRIGPWFGGRADASSLRAAVVYSKTPSMILLGMWAILLALAPNHAFIQNASNGSAVMIILTSLIVNCWSVGLLFRYLKTAQGFTALKTFCNLVIFYVSLIGIYIAVLFALRYVYCGVAT